MSAPAESNPEAQRIVTEALEALNAELQYESLDNVNERTVIWGSADGIDSLSLVQFAVDLEQRVEGHFGRRVVLTDAEALAVADSPFRSVGALVAYITMRLEG